MVHVKEAAGSHNLDSLVKVRWLSLNKSAMFVPEWNAMVLKYAFTFIAA